MGRHEQAPAVIRKASVEGFPYVTRASATALNCASPVQPALRGHPDFQVHVEGTPRDLAPFHRTRPTGLQSRRCAMHSGTHTQVASESKSLIANGSVGCGSATMESHQPEGPPRRRAGRALRLAWQCTNAPGLSEVSRLSGASSIPVRRPD